MTPSLLVRLWLNLRESRYLVPIAISILTLFVFGVLENRIYALKTIANDPNLDSLPDSHLTGYDPGWLQMYLSKLTGAGRNHYLHTILPIDCFFPLVYGAWFCVVLSMAYRSLGPLYIRFRFVLFLPLMAMVFDYCENLMLFQLISEYRNGISEQKADIASIFTQLKWCMVLASFIAIAIGFVTSIRYIRMTRHPLYRPR